MKVLGLGVPELLIILVVVLLIFGPKNLPKLGKAIGKSVKGLRDGMSDNLDSMDAEEETADPLKASEEDAKAEEIPSKKTVRVAKKVSEPQRA